MGSVFDINMDFSKPIENLEGEAPSPLELPEGCPFQVDVPNVWRFAKKKLRKWSALHRIIRSPVICIQKICRNK